MDIDKIISTLIDAVVVLFDLQSNSQITILDINNSSTASELNQRRQLVLNHERQLDQNVFVYGIQRFLNIPLDWGRRVASSTISVIETNQELRYSHRKLQDTFVAHIIISPSKSVNVLSTSSVIVGQSDFDFETTTSSDICSGDWSAWTNGGECEVTCGGGVLMRTFSLFSPASVSSGDCLVEDGDVEALECNTEPCPEDCDGSWGEWSECPVTCGGSSTFRKYSVLTNGSLYGVPCEAENDTVESAACGMQNCSFLPSSNSTYEIVLPTACLGEWDSWSNGGECAVSCGGGILTRTFNLIAPETDSDIGCDIQDGSVENQYCNTWTCPQDCYGAWGGWSDCQSTCGKSTKSRTFTIIRNATGGGLPCETIHPQLQLQECASEDCTETNSTADKNFTTSTSAVKISSELVKRNTFEVLTSVSTQFGASVTGSVVDDLDRYNPEFMLTSVAASSMVESSSKQAAFTAAVFTPRSTSYVSKTTSSTSKTNLIMPESEKSPEVIAWVHARQLVTYL